MANRVRIVTASFLLSSEGLTTLARYVAPDTLFAFDLDGTLAPITEDHTATQIAEPIRTILVRLVKLAKVAVITGRARSDALAILGFEPHLLVGNHGSEWPPQEGNPNNQLPEVCLTWCNRLQDLLGCEQGVEIDNKGASLTLHYGKADDAEKALSQINAAIETLVPTPRRISGKFDVNLLPMEAMTKGDALVAAMKMFGLKRAIFIGDDVTDEAVFKLKCGDIFGIHIGTFAPTVAPYYLNTQSEIQGLLNLMVDILEKHR
jgi:trehalose 6-phosphate phosphatase